METVVIARKVGGSVVATLPKSIVNELNIRQNEAVRIDIKKIEKNYFGRLAGIGKFSKKDELTTHD